MTKLYNRSSYDCARKLLEIPIIHVYGRLGPLQSQGKGGKSYGDIKINDVNEIGKISDQIEIPINPDEILPQFKEAHKVISHASRIYFLGFGYDDENLKRLKIKELHPKVGPNDLKGTGNGLGLSKINDIAGKWGIKVDRYAVDAGVIEFLRNEVIL